MSEESWEIKINRNECPYLEKIEFAFVDVIFKCNNSENKKTMNFGSNVICDKDNCPMKSEVK